MAANMPHNLLEHAFHFLSMGTWALKQLLHAVSGPVAIHLSVTTICIELKIWSKFATLFLVQFFMNKNATFKFGGFLQCLRPEFRSMFGLVAKLLVHNAVVVKFYFFLVQVVDKVIENVLCKKAFFWRVSSHKCYLVLQHLPSGTSPTL